MKKITLLVAGLLLAGNLALASESKNFSDETAISFNLPDLRYAEPIIFTERGIEFMIFPNGEMDFNTEPATTTGMYYKQGSREDINRTYGTGNNYKSGQGTRIEYDIYRRVRRVGNVFINYDNKGRIKRIGSVYMNYKSALLTQVGFLRVKYDNYGRLVAATGFVNNAPQNYSQYNYQDGNSNYYGSYGSNNNGQDNFYYRSATAVRKN